MRYQFFILCATLLCATSLAIAQEDAALDPPDDPPSLDDLLGIEEDENSESAAETAEQDTEEELQRELNEEEIADAFLVALEKMKLSAERLDVDFDTGLGTQRVQEDILAKLDVLIEAAKKNKNSSSSSSSSSSQQQQQQQSPGQQQQKNQQQQQADQRNQNPNDAQAGDPPPREEGAINTVLEETRTEWGTLPQRVREMLLQGRQDKYSSLYDRLTREYYKRLAEESTPN